MEKLFVLYLCIALLFWKYFEALLFGICIKFDFAIPSFQVPSVQNGNIQLELASIVLSSKSIRQSRLNFSPQSVLGFFIFGINIVHFGSRIITNILEVKKKIYYVLVYMYFFFKFSHQKNVQWKRSLVLGKTSKKWQREWHWSFLCETPLP